MDNDWEDDSDREDSVDGDYAPSSDTEEEDEDVKDDVKENVMFDEMRCVQCFNKMNISKYLCQKHFGFYSL